MADRSGRLPGHHRQGGGGFQRLAGPLRFPWTLVDAGWAGSAAAIRMAAESVFGRGTRPAAILLTHIHPDHSGSAGTLARSWDVPVYVHADEVPMAAGRYRPRAHG